jgi:hypothetical protein
MNSSGSKVLEQKKQLRENGGHLEEMGDIVEDGPGLHVLAVRGNLVVVDPVEQQGERLQEHQRGHHPVDPSHH